VVGTFTECQELEGSGIQKGIQELQSLDWKYAQSPQFIFSTHPTEEDPRPRPDLPFNLPPWTRVFLRVKSGAIIESHISTAAEIGAANIQAQRIHATLSNRKLHEISDWEDVLTLIGESDSAADLRNVANWLNNRLGL